jgi:hypothetical protein
LREKQASLSVKAENAAQLEQKVELGVKAALKEITNRIKQTLIGLISKALQEL